MKSNISAVIIARDEEAVIESCLHSLKGCSAIAEIIVLIDDRTVDATEVKSKLLADVVKTATFDDFSQMKNAALALAKKPWSLLIDADEQLSPELSAELVTLNPEQHTAFLIPEKNFLGTKWLRYGGLYPDYHIRLFKTGSAVYKGAVHETLTYSGSTGKLSGAFLHATYHNSAELFAKVRKYAALEGEGVVKSRRKAYFMGLKRFVGVYVKDLGILDGTAGFVHATALGYYQIRKYHPKG
jgi:glycosyltransferase involved in cell wall biosynthesis